MKLEDPLPRQISWVSRFIGWGFGGLIIFAMLYGIGRFKLARNFQACASQSSSSRGPQAAFNSAKELVACVDNRSGLEKILLSPLKKTLASLPNTPCQYVGVWTATRDNAIYKVTLKQDSSFLAEPYKNTPRGAESVTGFWGVSNQKMVWLYDTGRTWPPDINPIKDETPRTFTLIEMNGATTHYAALDGPHFDACQ